MTQSLWQGPPSFKSSLPYASTIPPHQPQPSSSSSSQFYPHHQYHCLPPAVWYHNGCPVVHDGPTNTFNTGTPIPLVTQQHYLLPQHNTATTTSISSWVPCSAAPGGVLRFAPPSHCSGSDFMVQVQPSHQLSIPPFFASIISNLQQQQHLTTPYSISMNPFPAPSDNTRLGTAFHASIDSSKSTIIYPQSGAPQVIPPVQEKISLSQRHDVCPHHSKTSSHHRVATSDGLQSSTSICGNMPMTTSSDDINERTEQHAHEHHHRLSVVSSVDQQQHFPPPCSHNNWDSLRAKKYVVTLSCRDCQQKWKQLFPLTNLCPEFHLHSACAFGDDCPFLHIHRFKSAHKSPNAQDHVVGAVRNELFAQVAIEVLAEFPGRVPRDVVDVVHSRFALVVGKSSEGQAR
ncbi:Hypothetical protein, putative [Bodo saltans]|uniref:C3H1-type domain-containing protein n=1 Tax=Bodo saltans TaxID=75058 RepID=A0A0S4IZ33_BODSA|nr:Hypothetical protein, putative [Bodo saltans]|eukprot:CUG14967.1 Hypothetical protein, putative [Bodo saltans]